MSMPPMPPMSGMPPWAVAAAALLLFHQLRDHRVGGEHQAGDRRGVLQRRARDLGRVDHALLHEIAVFLGLRVEAVVALVLEHLVEHHRGLRAGVVDDDAQRLFQRAHHDLDAGILVVVLALELAFERLPRAQERHAAAGDDAFLDRRTRGVQRVLDAGLLLLHLDFGRRADLDHAPRRRRASPRAPAASPCRSRWSLRRSGRGSA